MRNSLFRRRAFATVVLLAAATGCETLPTPLAQAATNPDELAQLELAASNCQAQLEVLREDRQGLQRYLEAEEASLTQMQASLQGMEKTLKAQLAPPPVPACPKVDVQLADKLIVGRREKVWIEDFQIGLSARIDTGAETASLDARSIEEFERDGKPWVRFDIVPPDAGEAVTVEREVERVTRILQSSSEQAERRVVISLGIVIGDIRQRAEFTLSDRSHLDYQVLIGRNILRDLMIVDVGKVNMAPVKAAAKSKKKAAP